MHYNIEFGFSGGGGKRANGGQTNMNRQLLNPISSNKYRTQPPYPVRFSWG